MTTTMISNKLPTGQEAPRDASNPKLKANLILNSDSQQQLELKNQQLLQQRSVNNFMPTQAP